MKSMSKKESNLPAPGTPIPDKLYFRIGDVAKLCGVEAYVLRFWETEFPQLKPNKSGTGQRLYRKRDVELALRIRQLLHHEGYTIAGARQVFAAEGREAKAAPQPELSPKRSVASPAVAERSAQPQLAKVRCELREILDLLSAPVQTTKSPVKIHRPSRTSFQNGPSLFDE